MDAEVTTLSRLDLDGRRRLWFRLAVEELRFVARFRRGLDPENIAVRFESCEGESTQCGTPVRGHGALLRQQIDAGSFVGGAILSSDNTLDDGLWHQVDVDRHTPRPGNAHGLSSTGQEARGRDLELVIALRQPLEDEIPGWPRGRGLHTAIPAQLDGGV